MRWLRRWWSNVHFKSVIARMSVLTMRHDATLRHVKCALLCVGVDNACLCFFLMCGISQKPKRRRMLTPRTIQVAVVVCVCLCVCASTWCATINWTSAKLPGLWFNLYVCIYIYGFEWECVRQRVSWRTEKNYAENRRVIYGEHTRTLNARWQSNGDAVHVYLWENDRCR